MHVRQCDYYFALFQQLAFAHLVAALSRIGLPAKTGSLELDKVVVIREVSFYALAIALLYFALQDVEPDDDSLGVDHIYVSFWEACMLFGGYLLYVVVCAKMDTIVDFLSIGKQSIPQQSRTVYGAIEESEVPRDMPYVTKYDDLSDEPKSNWNHVEYTMPSESFLSERIASNSEGLRNQPSSLSSTASFRLQDMSFRRSVEMVDKNNSLVNLIKHTERPTNIFTMYDIEDNEVCIQLRIITAGTMAISHPFFFSRQATGVLKCFLWQQSPFYTNARFGSHAWHLRWFTITSEYLSSVPDRLDSERHTMRYPRFKQLQVDNSRLIIRMVNPLPYKRDCT